MRWLLILALAGCAERALWSGDPPDGSVQDASVLGDGGVTVDLARHKLPVDLAHKLNPRVPTFEQGTVTFGNADFVFAGDIDHDGRVDLVTLSNTGALAVLIGDGTGSFATKATVSIPGSPYEGGRLVDIDGDGELDFLVADLGNSSVLVVKGPLGQSTSVQSIFLARLGGVTAVDAADLDGDGTVEIVATGQDSSVHVLRADTGKDLGRWSAGGDEPVGVAIADVDLDGQPDIITVNRYGNNVAISRNLGALKFSAANDISAGRSPASMVIVDLDGDGVPDVVVQNQSPYPPKGSATITVLPGDGSGGFGTPSTRTGGPNNSYSNWIGTADFDGDGYPDLISGTSEAGPASMSSSLSGTSTDFGTAARQAAIADFDGDGWPDIALTTYTGGAMSSPSGVRIYLNH
jgi:hypothetical protein